MTDTRSYYERYWEDPSTAPPSSDPTTPARKKLLALALQHIQKGRPAIDVGCGGGEFTEYLRSLGFEALGTDLSANAVEHAQTRYPQCKFLVGGPEQFAGEFQGRFQVAWASEVLEHVFDVYGFLTAVHRCLAPGGLLVLTTPYHGFFKNLALSFAGFAQHYRPFGGHIRFFNKASLNDCLTHCGFSVRQWSGIGRTWPLYKSFFVVAEKTREPLPPPPASS